MKNDKYIFSFGFRLDWTFLFFDVKLFSSIVIVLGISLALSLVLAELKYLREGFALQQEVKC